MLAALLCVAATALLAACGDDGDGRETKGDGATNPERTILMYYPWTGESSALTSYFWQNIASMKSAYDGQAARTDRIVVFIATSGSKGYLFDIDNYRGHGEDALASYQAVDAPQFTTADGILDLFNAMRAVAAAPRYALIIGCHGQGWIPTAVNATAAKAKGQGEAPFRPHWAYGEASAEPLTRLYGGTSAKYQTDVSTLAEAIGRFGVKMDYIVFDDCYMASVEVAYDLRSATDYLIACPTEVMGQGILGAGVAGHLLGTPDYAALCEGFRSHYAASSTPYGTISAIKTSEVDSLARVVKKINARYTFDASLTDSLQRMDGYLPTIFFDMGDYLARLCPDATLLAEAEAQLARTVPHKAHTPRFPTVIDQSGTWREAYHENGVYAIPIHAYSGLTIGEPTKYKILVPLYPGLAWYEATH